MKRGGKYGMIALSNLQESACSVAIVRDAVASVIDNAMRHGALPSTRKLVDAGLSREVADTLLSMIVDNRGNVTKGVSEFRASLQAGKIDMWRNMPIAPALEGFLKNGTNNLLDEYNNIRKTSKSAREYLRRVNNLTTDVFKNAANVAEDVSRTGTADIPDVGDAVAALHNVVDEAEGAISHADTDKFTAMVNAMAQVRAKLTEAMGKKKDALMMAYGKYETFAEPFTKLSNYWNEMAGRGTEMTTRAGVFRDEIRRISDLSKKGQTVWDDLIDMVPKFEGVEFAGTFDNPEAFRAALWKHYFNASAGGWLKFNVNFVNDQISVVAQMYRTMGWPDDVIKKTLGVDKWASELKWADEIFHARTLQAWTLPGMRDKDLMRKIFSKAGIPTIFMEEAGTVVGKYSDEELKVINTLISRGTPPRTVEEVGVIKKYFEKYFNELQTIDDNASALGRAGMVGTAEEQAADITRKSEIMKNVVSELKRMITPSGSAEANMNPGATNDRYLVNLLNKYLQPSDEWNDAQTAFFESGEEAEVWVKYTIDDLTNPDGRITVADVMEAIRRHFKKTGGEMPEGLESMADKALESFRAVPTSDNYVSTAARAQWENLSGFIKDIEAESNNVVKHWGETGGGFSNPQIEDYLNEFEKIAGSRMAEAKIQAAAIAGFKRDFALLAYKDKTNLDLAMSLVYPYQYWYSRTYINWMKRMVMEPEIVAAYAKYRNALETQNAGLPDWWKYNLSSNDLLGIDSENPLYFNLESSLNPLQGLVGVDFNDPNKRVTWYSRLADDLGKFGPTVFTPYNWLVAGALYAQGEEDAGRRWMGRLIPQTQTIKYALYGLGIKTPVKYNEFDPFVQVFSGGLDAYEERRVGRALGAWIAQGATDEEKRLREAQAQDAARSKTGELWEYAVATASAERAPGQLSSFFLGTGFKARSATDMQIDEFYSKYYNVMDMRPNLSPLEFRNTMTQLRSEYPWMDTLLISRKPDNERDTAYAYSVLTRIPPGEMTALIGSAGINEQMINDFFENKGQFLNWTPQDMERFMAGIVDLGAMLAIPDDATSYEWNIAKTGYTDVQIAVAQALGQPFVIENGKTVSKGVFDKIDYYWTLSYDDRTIYEQQNPDVRQALDMQTEMIINNPTLYKYYGGIDTLDRYYTGKMYAALEAKLGTDIHEKITMYNDLKVADAQNGTKTAKAYYNAHPELSQYYDLKAALADEIDRRVSAIAKRLPNPPTIPIRSDFVPQGQNQEELLGSAQPEPTMSWAQWQRVLTEPMQELLIEYYQGQPLPSAARSQLQYIMSDYGFSSIDQMLQAIGTVAPR
jgi:hypothetical protein